MQYVKRFLSFLLIFFLCSSIGFAIWIYDKHVVPILNYHHIDTKGYHELNVVSPQSFEKQMAYLKDHQYQVIRLSELFEAIRQNKKLPRKTVVLTFDDGSEDNYTAFKILKKYGFTAIFFLPTDMMNTEGFLSWDQIKEMANAGMDIGSHTRTHIYLPNYPDFEKVKDEIAGSKRILEEKLGIKIDYFCYPSGGFSNEIKELLKTAGYQGACTTNRGRGRLNKDVFELKRIRVKDKDTGGFSFLAKLSGYYNFFRKCRAPYSR